MTSGCEEEALFSVWKYTQNLPVYSDPHLIPFAASYFNWFFYYIYGNVAKLSLAWLHADSRWLPTICRVLSLAFALVGVGVCWLVLDELNPRQFFFSWHKKLAWSLLLIANPLSGFWLLTTRPDIGALVLELTGLLFLLRCLRTSRWEEIAYAALFLYGAWAFKHNFIAIWMGGCFVLLMLRKWQAFTLLITICLGLVFITLAFGGSVYRFSLFFSQIHCQYRFVSSFGFLFSALRKMPFLFLSLLGLVLYGPVKITRLAVANPIFLMLLVATILTFSLGFIFSGKQGAVDYYFLPAALYSGLLLAKLADFLRPTFFHLGLALACLISSAGVGFVLSGHYGAVDWRSFYSPQLELAEKLPSFPGPVFVSDRTGNLPWIQTKPPYFVVAFTYEMDEKAGEWHEHGGWEGLLREGYFVTVVTSPYNPIESSLLQNYALAYQDKQHAYYVRRPIDRHQ